MPFVCLPDEGLGWPGGDNYLTVLRSALTSLEDQGLLKLLEKPSSGVFVRILPFGYKTRRDSVYMEKKTNALHLPWPLLPGIKNPIQWIPDLQDVEEPDFFSEEERIARKIQILNAIEINTAFYFSSKYCEDLFIKTYPEGKSLGLLRFSVSRSKKRAKLPLNCDDCMAHGFYYSPNNWWRHKNHMLLLDSFLGYKLQGGKKHLVLSGTRGDYRWPKYAHEIEKKIAKISDIHYLGFVRENEKNSLIWNAFCLIQPSLYEGWSTSVEEALIYNRNLILSDLPVHLEQMNGVQNFIAFDRRSEESLIKSMLELEQSGIMSPKVNYQDREARFLGDLQALLGAAFTHKNG